MTLNIGLINYLNTMPFHYDLAERLQDADVHYERGVPSQLNRALIAGEIDLAPISAIEAARHAEDVVILPGLSISGVGAVHTVLLFSWAADMRDLDGQSIALTDHSATSVALLKLLCRERYHIEPEFVVMKQHLPSMLSEHQGALIIGDDALVEGAHHRAFPLPSPNPSPVQWRGREGWGLPTIYDLSDEWLKMTGSPFVFALWAARREKVEALDQAGVFEALYASTQAGLTEGARDTLAQAYAARLGLPVGVCRRYLRDLHYGLNEDDCAGLRRFLESALPDFDWEQLEFWGQRERAAF